MDKTYGRSLNPTTVYDFGIRVFLGRDPRRARQLASLFSRRLRQLAGWFEKQHQFAFYASSLLLAYDNSETSSSLSSLTARGESSTSPGLSGNSDERHHDNHNHNSDESIVAHLIDFTRWTDLVGNRDDNVLYGLYKLISLFDRAATDRTSPPSPCPPDRVFVRG
ncbi:unnamed protein product [Echinostoma caproni]|uniref:Kinase n=1 Tax=Echinostoma caproni TaxID=27848 RepID=A0A3P8HFE9_9TREM|nr:unnamed protein product [Echinostoma caproni]